MEEDSRKRKSEATATICCSGDYLNEECHKDRFKRNITDLETLPGDDQIVLRWRAQIMVSDTSVTISDHHKYKFGDKSVSKFKSANVCANIFSKYPKSKKKVKSGHVIILQMAAKLKSEGREATTGWQVRRSRYDEVMKEPDSTVSKQPDNEVSAFQEEINRTHEKERLDESLKLIGISPFKTHGLPVSTTVKAAKVKLVRSFQAQKWLPQPTTSIRRHSLETKTRSKKQMNWTDSITS